MMDMPRGLIVSCQALEGNPFRNSEALSLMAEAAEKGGAQAIRANGPADISAIRQKVSVPIIGLNKKKNECGRVVITPTFQSAEEVIRAGADIIAVDMTLKRIGCGKIRRKSYEKYMRNTVSPCWRTSARIRKRYMLRKAAQTVSAPLLQDTCPETRTGKGNGMFRILHCWSSCLSLRS